MAKKSRKQLLKQDDAFLAAANQSMHWLNEHRGTVTIGAIVLFVAVAVIVGGRELLRKRDLKASISLAAAQKILDAQIVDKGADPTATPPTFASKKDKWQAALKKFEQTRKLAGSSGVGDVARFYVGDIDTKLGNKKAAEKIFAQLVNDLSTSSPLYFLAIERTAYLQEASGNDNAALATLKHLITDEPVFYGDWARLHAARLYAAKGDITRARNLLDSIKKMYPDTELLDDIKQEVERLDAKSLAQAAPKSAQHAGTATPAPSGDANGAPHASGTAARAPDPAHAASAAQPAAAAKAPAAKPAATPSAAKAGRAKAVPATKPGHASTP